MSLRQVSLNTRKIYAKEALYYVEAKFRLLFNLAENTIDYFPQEMESAKIEVKDKLVKAGLKDFYKYFIFKCAYLIYVVSCAKRIADLEPKGLQHIIQEALSKHEIPTQYKIRFEILLYLARICIEKEKEKQVEELLTPNPKLVLKDWLQQWQKEPIPRSNGGHMHPEDMQKMCKTLLWIINHGIYLRTPV